jgi:hypothetical protein
VSPSCLPRGIIVDNTIPWAPVYYKDTGTRITPLTTDKADSAFSTPEKANTIKSGDILGKRARVVRTGKSKLKKLKRKVSPVSTSEEDSADEVVNPSNPNFVWATPSGTGQRTPLPRATKSAISPKAYSTLEDEAGNGSGKDAAAKDGPDDNDYLEWMANEMYPDLSGSWTRLGRKMKKGRNGRKIGWEERIELSRAAKSIENEMWDEVPDKDELDQEQDGPWYVTAPSSS